MTWALTLATLASLGTIPGSHVRYALVIGNNVGASNEVSLDPLQHAERDATLLAGRLISVGSFQADRVQVVVGKSRQDILAAAARLAAVRARDEAEFGSWPTLFTLFFTGHGLSGQLLTADQPLTGKDLSDIFTSMHAQLSLAFIDACYSGALDLGALRAKGIRVTPGFNPVTELPRELLDSEGTMWFVSSQAGELSYEDQQLGGLFTHYLLEAFDRAPRDAVGVSLDNLWEYARRETSTAAALSGHAQNPEKVVRYLKSRSPVYMAFKGDRSASLLFDSELEGSYVLLYEQASLVERIEKNRGERLELKAYPGEVLLSRLAGQGTVTAQRLALRDGSTVRIARRDAPVVHGVGFQDSTVRSKGALTELKFTETATQDLVALHGSARFETSVGGLALAPFSFGAETCFAHGALGLSLGVHYGHRAEQYSAWSYELNQVDAQLGAGYGFEVWGGRLELEVAVTPRLHFLQYGDSASKQIFGVATRGGLRLEIGIPHDRPWVLITGRAMGGAAWLPTPIASDSSLYLAPTAQFELGLGMPLYLH